MGKVAYQVQNWPEYNQALCHRGDITVWVEENTLESWYADPQVGKHGAQFLYNESAILCALTLRAIYHLPLRQTRGFLTGIFKMMGLKLDIPCYTTLCRRAKDLDVQLPRSGKPAHIVIDSTGLKVFGEGEWKVRTHGVGKRRTWRKLHLAVNPDTHEIVAHALTTNDVHDNEVLPDLLAGVDDLESVAADGAYDSHQSFDFIEQKGAIPLIPPREGAVIAQHGNSKQPCLARDEVVRAVKKQGKKKWKRESGYSRRSLAETAMFRVKQIFGSKLRSREFSRQSTESSIMCRALNLMTMIGMPVSVPRTV